MEDRRQFERVRLAANALVYAIDDNGHLIGPVRILGCGGMLVESQRKFATDSPHRITLVDEEAPVRREVTTVVRYHSTEGIGFEFRSLDVESAVEIGVLIGRHYVASRSAAA